MLKKEPAANQEASLGSPTKDGRRRRKGHVIFCRNGCGMSYDRRLAKDNKKISYNFYNHERVTCKMLPMLKCEICSRHGTPKLIKGHLKMKQHLKTKGHLKRVNECQTLAMGIPGIPLIPAIPGMPGMPVCPSAPPPAASPRFKRHLVVKEEPKSPEPTQDMDVDMDMGQEELEELCRSDDDASTPVPTVPQLSQFAPIKEENASCNSTQPLANLVPFLPIKKEMSGSVAVKKEPFHSLEKGIALQTEDLLAPIPFSASSTAYLGLDDDWEFDVDMGFPQASPRSDGSRTWPKSGRMPVFIPQPLDPTIDIDGMSDSEDKWYERAGPADPFCYL